MSRNLVTIVVVVLLILVGGWYLMKPSQQVSQPVVEPTQTPVASPSSASEGAMMKEEESMVKITSTGFSPKDITVKVGKMVTWENTDSANHTVNSAPHPTHTLYPFLNIGVIGPEEKKSVSFEKAGTYKYHDHLNPSLIGTVTVQ